MSDDLCQICFANKPFYICPDCKTRMCKKCLKKYILDYSNLEPHCMGCMSKLNFGTIFDIFGVSQFGKYLDKAAEIKFNIEIQKIPECIECCKVISKLKESNCIALPSTVISLCDTIIKFHYTVLDEALRSEGRMVDEDGYQLILEVITKIVSSYTPDTAKNHGYENLANRLLTAISAMDFTKEQYDHVVEHTLHIVNTNFHTDINESILGLRSLSETSIINKFVARLEDKELGKALKQEYLFRCENGDCKGFVDCKCKCDLCGHAYCPKCFVDITGDTNHQCKEEDILTAKEIMDSTKPCPKCAARIFKISGCSQMFCTNCHIGFDYNTGKIIKSNFHNPHRMEWLRANGGALANEEVGCDGRNVDFLFNPYLMWRLYQMNHIKAMIRKMDRKEASSGKDLFYTRCKFVLNRISDYSFKQYLRKAELEKYKSSMLRQIYDEYVGTATIIINSSHHKDEQMRKMMTTDRISSNLYHFVVCNNLTSIIQSIVNSVGDVSRKDFCYAIDKFIRTREDGGEETVIPLDCEYDALMSLAFENREYITLFDTFEEENRIFNELIKHINDLLVKYKTMFKISSVS